MNNDLFFKDCFTEVDDGKINVGLNKATVKCFDSEDNKFSMDCEGNLVVNSIITREQSNTTGVTVDQIYPIGSIYMSVNATNPSILFGGTWEAWGNGRVPVGVDINQEEFNSVEKQEGNKNIVLSTSNLPSHTHTTPNHAHSFGGATDGGGNHNHSVLLNYDPNFPLRGYPGWDGGNVSQGMNMKTTYSGFNVGTDASGNHTHSFSGTTSNNNGGNTGATGSGEAISTLQPYITCYMWKRVA